MLKYFHEREQNPCKKSRIQAPFIHLEERAILSAYPENPTNWKLDFLKRKSKVTEILSVNENIIITLQNSGVCCVFKRLKWTLKQFGYLNHKPQEIIRSLFHNQSAAAIVIVSVYPVDKKSVLRCRSIPVNEVEQGNFHKSTPILDKEMLEYPGWIELCEVNSRILTHTSENDTYRVWSLRDYTFLFEIKNHDSEEKLLDVKASPGFLLLLHDSTSPDMNGVKKQRITLLDIDDGRELYVLNHHVTTKIELVEQFCDSILIKEQDQDLIIHNIRNPSNSFLKVKISELRLSAFTFLHNTRIFLTFQNHGRVISFNSKGEELCVIHDANPCIDSNNSIFLVARDQETLLSVRPDFQKNEKTPNTVIDFKYCLDGLQLGKLTLPVPPGELTCLCYDDEKMALYIGMKDGTIRVWY